jgi:hypothetical protein
MSSREERFRPNLHVLEDRTLLTSATLQVDPTQSALTITGTIYSGLGNADFMEQGPGSLTTTYSGSIQVDLDLVNQTIQFLNDGGQAVAGISGQWMPDVNGAMGSSDANYGTQFVLFGTNYTATRDMTVGNTSVVLPLNTSDNVTYTFSSAQTLTITNANLDYHTTVGFGDGRTTGLTGTNGQNQAADSTLVDNGDGTFTLTAPINATIEWDIDPTSMTYALLYATGQFSATGTYDMNAPAFGQSFAHQAIGVGGIANTSTQTVSLGTTVLTSTLDTQNLGQGSNLGQVIASTTHHSGTAVAVDAVFQDPLQTGSL